MGDETEWIEILKEYLLIPQAYDLMNETEWIEIFKEYLLIPQAYDLMTLKYLREESHARDTLRKAARHKRVTLKGNRPRQNFRPRGNFKTPRNSSRMQHYRHNWEMNLNYRLL